MSSKDKKWANSQRPPGPSRRPESTGPAQTFAELMAKIDTGPAAPEPKRTPSLKQRTTRAMTATRKLIIGKTENEKASDDVRALVERVNQIRSLRRTQSLRPTVLSAGSIDKDDLYELAKHEGVYLTPQPTRGSRFEGDDYDLVNGIVARVSGRLDDDQYIFLGSDRALYIGRHELGRGARRIFADEESQYSEYREVARAYYQLCMF